MTVYLNTFETWQAYGGSEEGGWWYTAGEPVQSVLVSHDDLEEWLEKTSEDERMKMLRSATLMYTRGQAPKPSDTGYGGYVFMPGSEEPHSYRQDNSFKSWFEESYAESFPRERPIYE